MDAGKEAADLAQGFGKFFDAKDQFTAENQNLTLVLQIFLWLKIVDLILWGHVEGKSK